MELTVLYSDKYKIAGVSADGECQAYEFLVTLEANYKSSGDGLFELLDRVSKSGLQDIPTTLSHIVDKEEKIYEFIKGDLRLFYFKGLDNYLVICTSAAIKKSQKVDDKHVNKAIKFKNQYFQSVKDGTLVLLEEN